MGDIRLRTTVLTWQPEGLKAELEGRKQGGLKWNRSDQSWVSARVVASYRGKWMQCIGAFCSSGQEEDMRVIAIILAITIAHNYCTLKLT